MLNLGLLAPLMKRGRCSAASRAESRPRDGYRVESLANVAKLSHSGLFEKIRLAFVYIVPKS